MNREKYEIFSQGMISSLKIQNRLVRSATWDPSILKARKMSAEVLKIYEDLAKGGVGMIITGGFPAVNNDMLSCPNLYSYRDIQIDGLKRMVDTVHRSRKECKIVAQIENDYLDAVPSSVPSPFDRKRRRPLAAEEIRHIVRFYAEAVAYMQESGFDGVQLHAAHNGLLSCFISPYKNRREDEYGGSMKNRVRIIREIVTLSRDMAGDFPILIKINCTDYVDGGIDQNNFQEHAEEIEKTGVDAIEVSGGMWDCLIRPQSELGFPPVPSPESHTRIKNPDKQCYFLPYVQNLKRTVPIILVGGARNIEQLENIIKNKKAHFIAMSRPLICEPDLPNRWRAGTGSDSAACISCNSCLYSMLVHPGRDEAGPVDCTFRRDKAEYMMAQKWLTSWVRDHISHT